MSNKIFLPVYPQRLPPNAKVAIMSNKLIPFTFHRLFSFSNIWQMWSKKLWNNTAIRKKLNYKNCLQMHDNLYTPHTSICWKPGWIREKKNQKCWYIVSILSYFCCRVRIFFHISPDITVWVAIEKSLTEYLQVFF